ncbi:MFS transporter [Streptomyces sp. NRRL S-350]|uniref:MFS transporter n=1 Tax=Streptomyces sp. NRRL S-350 TaxID=1463902 RepID=UPI00068D640B|nr:MFS transporter [Streptomyces sp. NRRL S-350]
MLSKRSPGFPGERSLMAALAIDALGNGMYVPFSLVFFRHVTGLPLAVIGLVLTATGLLAMVSLPLVGTAVDRFGARRMQIALHLVRAAGFAVYPFASALPAFVAVTLVTAVATRGYPAVQQARIGELASGTALERVNALSRSLANAGLGAGSMLAALLVGVAGDGGYTVAALLNAVSFVAAAALVRRVPDARPEAVDGPARPDTGRVGYRAVLADRPFLGLATANLLISLGYAALAVLLPVYVTGVLHASASLPGVAFAVNTVLCAALGVPAGLAVRRFTTRNRAAATGAALFAAGFLAQALLVPAAGRFTTAGLLAVVVVITLGEIIHNPAASALVTATAPAAVRGRYMAAYQLSWSLSAAVAPSLLTGLLALDSRLPWLVLAAAVLAGAGLLLRLERRLPAGAVHPEPQQAALATAA